MAAETGRDSSGMQGKCKTKRWAIFKPKRVDRISGLPEDVLLHILSFITTRQAIELSLVSKRWRHLWTSIPALCFEDIEFFSFFVLGYFIDKVLARRREDKSIRKVHFLFHDMVDESCLTEWIIYATRGRNIQELVIESKYSDERFKLPPYLFSCESLQVLKLNIDYFDFYLPDEFRLSGLKSLYLFGFVSIPYSLGRLISSCPFLEDLYLEYCVFDSITISGEQLRKLSIIDPVIYGSKIQVSAPNLLSFEYFPTRQQHCSLENLVSLVEADITIAKLECGTSEIFEGFSNVSILNLTFTKDKDVHLLPELLGCLPTFHNLTTLNLNVRSINDAVQTIVYILQHCPNLTKLIINNKRPGHLRRHKKKMFPHLRTRKGRSPQILLKLKEIEIINFESTAIEKKLLTFLMRNSQNLKRVSINNV